MKIECPQCGFCRQVNPDSLPGHSVIATCPKCSCRFRFSPADGARSILSSKDAPVGGDGGANRRDRQEEEDIRLVASRAYAKEAERFSGEQQDSGAQNTFAGENAANPWDMAPGTQGWLVSFYQCVLRVMFSAQDFFSNLNPRARLARPLLFYLVICIAQTLVERFWGQAFYTLLAPSVAGDPQLEKLLSMLAQQSNIAFNLLIRCGMLILQIYILSFLMYLAYRIIARDRAAFALIFQVMAYSYSPALLCLIPILGSLAGMIWGLACMLIGLKSAMRLNWPQTILGFLPLLFLFAPILPQLMAIMQK